jgi:hypothetical protein
MTTNLVLENDDVFCGDTFIMTIDRFDDIDISVKEGRLFINNTFVKNFDHNDEAKKAITGFLETLEHEEVGFDLYIA